MSTGVADQVILITGAASGIGKALVEGFLADGASVMAVDVDEAGLATLKGDRLLAHVADVSDAEAVANMIGLAVSHFGRLDVLFNNAGIGVRAPLVDHAPADFERLIRVNLVGPFLAMQVAMPLMQQQGGGHIINTLSRAGEAGGKGFGAYGASKAGLYTLMRTAAREMLGTGVRINGLIPGPTRSGMNPKAPQDPADVYPTARWMVETGAGDQTGRVFWNRQEYLMFDEGNVTFKREIA
ncbi:MULTISPECIES: SDR family oxidoreductase [unclassified Minwuia]|jgi:NAD(P)-dependent dehydrogenase (short-subunit alcohol dehydrogenase family)|uniref:SDR family NAD(P)-dependent oxidoreductase n=1 Tax=unclassified Minwuia TaxID=2618799 RepID=UPI00247A25FA|nr:MULTISPECIES: SDR family oxidoreductase [unclassified Minwuia]